MTIEADLRCALLQHEPRGERERSAVARTITELDRLARPLDEHADPVHVTGSALVVSRRGIVLHRHRRLRLWLQPGGHVDPGEAPADTAVRETREETGLLARHAASPPPVFHVDVHPGGRGHVHLDVRYLLVAAPEDPSPQPGESPDVAWFPLEEARRLADPGLVEALHHPDLENLLHDPEGFRP